VSCVCVLYTCVRVGSLSVGLFLLCCVCACVSCVRCVLLVCVLAYDLRTCVFFVCVLSPVSLLGEAGKHTQ